jgi:hypothetical protein
MHQFISLLIAIGAYGFCLQFLVIPAVVATKIAMDKGHRPAIGAALFLIAGIVALYPAISTYNFALGLLLKI